MEEVSSKLEDRIAFLNIVHTIQSYETFRLTTKRKNVLLKKTMNGKNGFMHTKNGLRWSNSGVEAG
jgi:hypothetical protein